MLIQRTPSQRVPAGKRHFKMNDVLLHKPSEGPQRCLHLPGYASIHSANVDQFWPGSLQPHSRMIAIEIPEWQLPSSPIQSHMVRPVPPLTHDAMAP